MFRMVSATMRALLHTHTPAVNLRQSSFVCRLPHAAQRLYSTSGGRLVPGYLRGSVLSKQHRCRSNRILKATVCSATATTEPETFRYQAEVDRLMDMIVHSLYSNRDVFLRELVSNASDALDKERFLSLTKPEKAGATLEIRIKGDKDARTVTIEDTGVGMTKAELLDSLGTIARSGTAKFMEAIKESQGDTNLIGQFGVGFYSSFLVADRVKVETKNDNDDKQWEWESKAGAHSFTIKESTGPPLERGTRLTLYLKEDAVDYADDKKLEGLIKQYSEFISFPIYLYSAQQQKEEIVDDVATKKAQEDADAKAKEEGKEPEPVEPEPVEPVMKTEYKTVFDYKVQNDTKPLWLRTPKDVTKDEYDGFFKTTFKEFLEPLAWNHFNVEGTIEFTGLLFVPGVAPFNQMDPSAKSKNIRLYVKRVFISDEFDADLMPRYLNFIKGIVDSSDLPLNVSREILQESRIVRVIKKQLVKRSLDMLQDIAKRGGEDYETFWSSFGRQVKLGVIEDTANKDALAKLLHFPSSAHSENLTSLADYCTRMKEGQTGIYFMAADSMQAAANAPFVERLIKKGYEVLYFAEPIDEYCGQALSEFDGKKLVDVSREELDLGADEEEKKKVEEATEQLRKLTEFMKKCLEDKVEKVTVSNRLADSPCALVTSKFGWSANMERIYKSQSLGDNRAMEYMRGKRIMEVNPDHPVLLNLNALVGDGTQQQRAKDLVNLLYETALLTSGFNIESPKEFARRIYDMMGVAASLDSSVSSGNGSKSQGSTTQQAEPEVITPEVLEEGQGQDDVWRTKKN